MMVGISVGDGFWMHEESDDTHEPICNPNIKSIERIEQ